MYYILYEGLKIESNEPVYCTLYTVQCIQYIVYVTNPTLIQCRSQPSLSNSVSITTLAL